MRPTASPTTTPSEKPTRRPTTKPTPSPTGKPTNSPTARPTTGPTKSPTSHPTESPTASPFASPTFIPSALPTKQPTEPSTEEEDIEQQGGRPTRPGGRPPSRFRPSVPAFTPDSVVSASMIMPSVAPVASPTGSPSKSPTKHPSLSPIASPTSSPTVQPTPEPTREPTYPPTRGPTYAPTRSPSGLPTSPPSEPFVVQDNLENELPPEIDCSNYDVAGGYERMCLSATPCCDSIRSGTNYCWNIYDRVFPGPAIESACYHCCSGKIVGPEKPKHPEKYEKTLQCSDYNVQRYCRRNSCCENGWDSSNFCRREFERFGPRVWEELCVSPELRLQLHSNYKVLCVNFCAVMFSGIAARRLSTW